MQDKKGLFSELSELAVAMGAFRASVIDGRDIVTDRAFRAMCESNACGMYGRCYVCPPDCGDIDKLMEQIPKFDHALVYQTVTVLEDSYDFEGMIEARKRTYPISQDLRRLFREKGITKVLHLGAGGCGVCEVCAKRTDEPCRHPDLAMHSLESYGVNVSSLAKSADMKYINGQDTVTYFGAVLFSLDGDAV